MADEADNGNDQVEKYLEMARRIITQNTETPQNMTGKCLNCLEPVSENRRWCDGDCRDVYLLTRKGK
jgi:hypothetical protein